MPRGNPLLLDRRAVIMSSLGLAIGGAMSRKPASAAQTEMPPRDDRAPPFYRFRLGSAEVTVVSDGPFALENPSAIFLGGDEGRIETLLSDNFLPADKLVLQQNILIVDQGGKRALFDAGMGSFNLFGASTGRLERSLAGAGISPREIDAVVCSHAHVDHIGGLVGDGGAATFPNAQIYIDEADFEFWTDDARHGARLRPFVEVARRCLLPHRDRIIFFKDGEEFLPGIQALAAPGHTVGHTCFLITSGKETLCFGADLAHHHIVMLEQPRLEVAFDTDPKEAVASRLRILNLLARERIALAGYHFPWPGIGHVARVGEGFRYVPTPMQLVME